MKYIHRLFSHTFFSVVLIFSVVQFTGCANEEESGVTGDCIISQVGLTLAPGSVELGVGESDEIEAVVVVVCNCSDVISSVSVSSSMNNPQENAPFLSGCSDGDCANNMGACNMYVNVPEGTEEGTYTLEAIASASTDDSDGYGSAFLTVNVTNNPTYDFNISLPAEFGVALGSEIPVNVSITREPGHELDIELYMEDEELPDHISYTFEPSTVTINDPSSLLTVSAGYEAIPGEYFPLLAKANDGNVEKHAVFELNVIEPFHLTVLPAMIEISQGQSGSVELHTNRIGMFTFPITLSAEGDLIGQGIDVAFDPNPVNGESSNTTIDVDNAVAIGTYPVTIKGLGDELEKQVVLTVEVVE